MFLRVTAFQLCLLAASQAAAEPIMLSKPKALSHVIRCSERSYAEDILDALQVSQAAGEIVINRYAGQINQFGLRHCNEVNALPLLIGALEPGVDFTTVGGETQIAIAEVRLGVHTEDIDNVGYIILTLGQYQALLGDPL